MDDDVTGTQGESINDAVAEEQLLAGYSSASVSDPTERPGQRDGAGATGEGEKAAPATEYVQISKADFDSLMALRNEVPTLKSTIEKQFGTAFGKIGGIERWRSDFDAQTAKAAEFRSRITDDKIKALRDGDFGEHADALEIIRNLPFVPGQAQANVDEVVSARVDAAVKEVVPTLVQQGIQINELTSLHPDWEDVRNEPGFDAYKKALPQAEQDKLRDTWDIKYVAGHLTKYKQSKEKVQSIHTARRASRLAAGATASGTGSTSMGSDPEAEFDAGFKTRRVGN